MVFLPEKYTELSADVLIVPPTAVYNVKKKMYSKFNHTFIFSTNLWKHNKKFYVLSRIQKQVVSENKKKKNYEKGYPYAFVESI